MSIYALIKNDTDEVKDHIYEMIGILEEDAKLQHENNNGGCKRQDKTIFI